MDSPRPDHKDWTWVLDRRCPDCGYDGSTIDRHSLAAAARANAGAWRTMLKRGDLVTIRPTMASGDSQWSVLEYGCHTRDVYGVAADRIALIVKKRSPTFADWDQNQAALDGGYASQDPDQVSYALAVNAGKFADLLDRVRDSQWDKTGTRSDGAEFTLQSIATYMLHDTTHHLRDAQNGIDAILEQRKRTAEEEAG